MSVPPWPGSRAPVPAALSISNSPFVVYTSNVFAILGLRSLYVVVAVTLAGLRYLKYGIASVLLFAAFKVGGHSLVHVRPLASVAIIALLIGTAVTASILYRRAHPGATRRLSAP